MVRYKVKPDRAAENAELVRAVYDELQRAKAVRTFATRLPARRRVSFVHIAVETETDGSPLPQLEAFKAFQRTSVSVCRGDPGVSEMRAVGPSVSSADESGAGAHG